MAPAETLAIDERYLDSGDEAGTAPGDRSFRPDVEGLRAVAIALVVLYHANVPGVRGGFVGVDVFFVISGFVITGVLLRERAATGRTSILAFYGRRCRRIIPAAALVILVTVLLSYHLLGFVTGNSVAVDGRWAAVFLSNFHFAAVGTNYLSSLRPPSPLQNYWSLSVEEQFYAVFPMVFLLVAGAKWRHSLPARMVTCLTVVIVGSFTLSVVQTSTNPTLAFFSPFTRAWELALGALIAVGTSWLARIPAKTAAMLTWLGIGMVLAAAVVLDAHMEYPGALVAVPVVGSGLIIAGGASAPRFGVERLLGRASFRALGRLSYSLYLWHWPILILAAESQGQDTLSAPKSLWWVAVAVGASIGTYYLVENPIRHATWAVRAGWVSVLLGAALTAVTLGVLTVQIDSHGGSGHATVTPNAGRDGSSLASIESVRRLVATATEARTLPADLSPPVGAALFDFGIPGTWTGCSASYSQTKAPACTFGDPAGNHTLVLYGDSHALMWARAIDDIAIRAKWRFVLLAKSGCPVDDLSVHFPSGSGAPAGEWAACDQWHQTSIDRINRLDPDVLVATQAVHARPDGQNYTALQWKHGLEDALNKVTSPRTMKVVLGDIPQLPQSGPDCLARHAEDVGQCSGPLESSFTPYDRAEQAAAAASKSGYIDVTPWFCSHICTAVIGNYEVYVDRYHVTNTYARYLEGVLGDALKLPVLQPLSPQTSDPHTNVLVPADGSILRGTEVLDARASDNVDISRVEFRLTGGAMKTTVIAFGKPSLAGWIASWNTAAVPNGTYQLESVAHDVAGKVDTSKPVSVFVRN